MLKLLGFNGEFANDRLMKLKERLRHVPVGERWHSRRGKKRLEWWSGVGRAASCCVVAPA